MPARVGQTTITLNVYDLSTTNDITGGFGIGVYHTGLAFGGEEFTFSGSGGIFSMPPKEAGNATFRESVVLGTFAGSSADARYIIHNMKDEYPASSYHLILKNCNSFTNDASLRILNTPIPAYVNRLAYFGSFVSCLFPKEMNGQEEENTKSTTKAVPSFTGRGNRLNVGQTNVLSKDELRVKQREAALRRFEKRE